MTSPIPPQAVAESSEAPALTPSMKIFVAVAIIVGGAAVAIVFWKATLDLKLFYTIINPAYDQRLSTAPMPTLEAQGKESDLPSLQEKPVVDGGQGKYQQAYIPPPILEPPKVPTVTPTVTPTVPVASPVKSSAVLPPPLPEDKQRHVVEKPVITPVVTSTTTTKAQFEPLRKLPTPPQTMNTVDPNSIQRKPPVAPSGANDKMLSLFHFADNLEPSRQATSGAPPTLPENPFLTTPVPDDVKNRSGINSNLVPLQLPTSLVPLKVNPKS